MTAHSNHPLPVSTKWVKGVSLAHSFNNSFTFEKWTAVTLEPQPQAGSPDKLIHQVRRRLEKPWGFCFLVKRKMEIKISGLDVY